MDERPVGTVVQATWNGILLAESTRTVRLEGNHYFPVADVRMEHLRPSAHKTTCAWKGQASYYDVVAHGKENRQAAWTYREPLPAAREIKDHIAFWHGVLVR